MNDKHKLIEENMKLVYFTINKQFPSYIHDEDVIQHGMIGLCKAANTWKEGGAQFSTYAVNCIRVEIYNAFRYERNHPYPKLSLDYDYSMDDDNCSLGELIQGDEDVKYFDLFELMDKLTPTEQKILTLLQEGMSQRDIAKVIGLTHQRISQLVRKIRLLWRDVYGN